MNLQYRITLELELREQEIMLIDVGSHGEVYWSGDRVNWKLDAV